MSDSRKCECDVRDYSIFVFSVNRSVRTGGISFLSKPTYQVYAQILRNIDDGNVYSMYRAEE